MQELSQSIQEVKVAFADTLFEGLKPFLDVFKGFLNILKDNAPLRVLILLVAGAAAVGLLLYGSYKLVTGAIAGYQAALKIMAILEKHGLVTKAAHTVSVHGVTMAYWQLAVAVAAALGTFALTYMILKDMPPAVNALIAVIFGLAAAFWALYIAESAASLGIAAALGGVAAGAAAAVVSQYQGMQFGTRGLPYTGLFYGHKGEVVYDPQTERPTGVGKDLEGEGIKRTEMDVAVNIENLNVKSDFDEFDSKMRRVLLELARESR